MKLLNGLGAICFAYAFVMAAFACRYLISQLKGWDKGSLFAVAVLRYGAVAFALVWSVLKMLGVW